MTTPGPFDKHGRQEPNSGIRGMGLRPPTPAEAEKHLRDFPLALVAEPPPVALPARAMLPVWPNQDQNGRGACAVFAMGRVALAERARIYGPETVYDLSEEALYLQHQIDVGQQCQDTGSSPGTLADIICKKGVVGEWYMPYLSTNLCGPMPDDIRAAMAAERGMLYAVCLDDQQIKQAVSSGHRVCACFLITSSFERLIELSDGSLEMPAPTPAILGGHAMDFYGYDDARPTRMGVGAYAMQNQWGYDTTIWVPYQLCHLPGWQSGGPGLWYDNAYTIQGWNGELEPIAAPAPTSAAEVKRRALEMVALAAEGIREIDV